MINSSDNINVSDYGLDCIEIINMKEAPEESLETEVRFLLEGILLPMVGAIGLFGEQTRMIKVNYNFFV